MTGLPKNRSATEVREARVVGCRFPAFCRRVLGNLRLRRPGRTLAKCSRSELR